MRTENPTSFGCNEDISLYLKSYTVVYNFKYIKNLLKKKCVEIISPESRSGPATQCTL